MQLLLPPVDEKGDAEDNSQDRNNDDDRKNAVPDDTYRQSAKDDLLKGGAYGLPDSVRSEGAHADNEGGHTYYF
jgi:hypothetical protein